MGCLYCGKEISPLRQLRDEDFCSADHRSQHNARLRKALTSLAAPEPPPAGVAGFLPDLRAAEGGAAPAGCSVFQASSQQTYRPSAWRLRIAPSLAGSSEFLTAAEPLAPREDRGRPVPADWMMWPLLLPVAAPVSAGHRPAALPDEAEVLAYLPKPASDTQRFVLAAALAANGRPRKPGGPVLNRIAGLSLPSTERPLPAALPLPVSRPGDAAAALLIPIAASVPRARLAFNLDTACGTALAPHQAPEAARPIVRQPDAAPGSPRSTTAGAAPLVPDLQALSAPELPLAEPAAGRQSRLVPAAADRPAEAALAGRAAWIQAPATSGMIGATGSSGRPAPGIAGPAMLGLQAQAGSDFPALAGQIVPDARIEAPASTAVPAFEAPAAAALGIAGPAELRAQAQAGSDFPALAGQIVPDALIEAPARIAAAAFEAPAAAALGIAEPAGLRAQAQAGSDSPALASQIVPDALIEAPESVAAAASEAPAAAALGIAEPAGLRPQAQAGSDSPASVAAAAFETPAAAVLGIADSGGLKPQAQAGSDSGELANRRAPDPSIEAPALLLWPTAAMPAVAPWTSAALSTAASPSVPLPPLPAGAGEMSAGGFAPAAGAPLADIAPRTAPAAAHIGWTAAATLPAGVAGPCGGAADSQGPAAAVLPAAGFAALPAAIAPGVPHPASMPAVEQTPAGPAIPVSAGSLAAPADLSWCGGEAGFAPLATPAVAAAAAMETVATAMATAAPPPRLPDFTFALAQPPIPYPADLSPDAVAAPAILVEPVPAASPSATWLPGFSLPLALLPAVALPPSVAPPPRAYPAVAAGLRPAEGRLALPAFSLEPGAAGLESLLTAVPGMPAALPRRSPGSAAAWMPPEMQTPEADLGAKAAGPTPAPAADGLPAACAPRAADNRGAARLEFVPAPGDTMPDPLPADSSSPSPRRADAIPVEFYVQRGRPAPYSREQWNAPRPEISLPRMTVQAVPVALDQMALRKPVQPEVPRAWRLRSYSRSSVALWGKGLAAGVAVCAFLWIGSHAIRMERNEPREAAAKQDPIALPAPPLPSSGGGGVMSNVRRVIAGRAKVEVGSDFRTGGQFWDGARPNWGRGWERHRDGFTRPGALALLRPSLQLTDYRVEFMGQIENKSMSWAVRAHDVDNYYAMKLNVVAPGLRPVISVVRYAVVNGKRGRRVEVPLPVMVHNNMPYRVAVDVRGNRFVTSVEGEQVDSWTDDTLAAGGVGFFSEGVERSRLYWVRVTNNDDLLGRICAYISGRRGAGQEAAFAAGHEADDESGGRRPALAALPPRGFRRVKTAPGWAHSG